MKDRVAHLIAALAGDEQANEAQALAARLKETDVNLPALADTLAAAQEPREGRRAFAELVTLFGVAVAGLAVCYVFYVSQATPGMQSWSWWWAPMLVTGASLWLGGRAIQQNRLQRTLGTIYASAHLARRLVQNGLPQEEAEKVSAYVYGGHRTDLSPTTVWAQQLPDPDRVTMSGTTLAAAVLLICLSFAFWFRYLAVLDTYVSDVLAGPTTSEVRP